MSWSWYTLFLFELSKIVCEKQLQKQHITCEVRWAISFRVTLKNFPVVGEVAMAVLDWSRTVPSVSATPLLSGCRGLACLALPPLFQKKGWNKRGGKTNQKRRKAQVENLQAYFLGFFHLQNSYEIKSLATSTSALGLVGYYAPWKQHKQTKTMYVSENCSSISFDFDFRFYQPLHLATWCLALWRP